MNQIIKSVSVALCLGWAIQVPAEGDAVIVQPVVNGTVHEALFAIAFDGKSGLAVGAPGAILSTADGGTSWKLEADVPTELTLLGVAMRGEHEIAVGQQGLVLYRDGQAWKKGVSGADKKRLFSVSVNSKGQAVTVGSFGVVLKSEDGGATWMSIAPDWINLSLPGADPGVEPHLYSAKIDEAGAVTIAGEFGLIMRSAGRGNDWKTLHSGDASLFALELRDDGVGYAVGQSGTVLRSSDRGATWKLLDSGSKAILLGVKSVSDGRVAVTGMRDMLVSSDNGSNWKHVTGGDVSTSWYQGVAQAGDDTRILAVGHSGQIVAVGS